MQIRLHRKLPSEFIEIFEAPSSVNFSVDEIQEIRGWFTFEDIKHPRLDKAACEEATRLFAEKLEQKAGKQEIDEDDFVTSLGTACETYFKRCENQVPILENQNATEALFQEIQEKNHESQKNTTTLSETDLAKNQYIGLQALIRGLLECFKKEPFYDELSMALNNTPYDPERYSTNILKNILTPLYRRKSGIILGFSDKSPEYQLIIGILSAFMLYSELTNEEYGSLIKALSLMYTSDAENAPRIPLDEKITRDLFYLRAKTVNCETFFEEVVTQNYFEDKKFPSETTEYLLTFTQFEGQISYKVFIETLVKALQHYRTTPIEKNTLLISRLILIGIQPLLDRRFQSDTNLIPQEVEEMLQLLSKVYKQSVLIPETIFKNAVERLLLKQIERLPPAYCSIPEEIEFDKQLLELYEKYIEFHHNKADQEIFFQKLISLQREHVHLDSPNEPSIFSSEPENKNSTTEKHPQILLKQIAAELEEIFVRKVSNSQPVYVTPAPQNKPSTFSSAPKYKGPTTEEEYQRLLNPLFKNINPNNYPYIKKRIQELLDRDASKAHKAFVEFKATTIAEASLVQAALQTQLINELDKESHANDSPLLQALVKLHPDPSSLWSCSIWNAICRIVQDPPNQTAAINALISALNYGILGYGQRSQSDKDQKLPHNWAVFNELTAWLVYTLAETLDESTIQSLKAVLGDAFQTTLDFPTHAKRPVKFLKSLGEIIAHYKITACKEAVIEKAFSVLTDSYYGRFYKPQEIKGLLLELAPLFYNNAPAFNALLKVTRTQFDFTFLKTLEATPANQKIVEDWVNHCFLNIENKRQKTPEKACDEIFHQCIQGAIIDAYTVLNQQGVAISDAILETYLKHCKTDQDYAEFIAFLKTTLPTRKYVDPDNNVENFLIKTVQHLTADAYRAVMLQHLRSSMSSIKERATIQREIIQLTLPTAIEKFSQDIECYYLLSFLEEACDPTSFNLFRKEELQETYANLAEKFLVYLQDAFATIQIPKALIENSKLLGGHFLEGLETLCSKIDETKQDISTTIATHKNDLLQITHSGDENDEFGGKKIARWHSEFRYYLQQIKELDKKASDALQTLPQEIENQLNALVEEKTNDKEEMDTLLAGLRENPYFENKSYQLIRKLRPHFSDNPLLEKEFVYYFNILRIAFTPFYERRKHLLKLTSNFQIENLKERILSRLKNQPLAEQLQILEELEKNHGETKEAANASIKSLELVKNEAQQVLSTENRQFKENLDAQRTQIPQKLEAIRKEIGEREQEKTAIEACITEDETKKQSCHTAIEKFSNEISESKAALARDEANLAASVVKGEQLARAVEQYFSDNSQENLLSHIAKEISAVFQERLDAYKEELKDSENALGFQFAKWIVENDYSFVRSWATAYVDRVERQLPNKIGDLEDSIRRMNALALVDYGATRLIHPTSNPPDESLLAQASICANRVQQFIEFDQRNKARTDAALKLIQLPDKLNTLIQHEAMQAACKENIQRHTQIISENEQKITTLTAEIEVLNQSLSPHQTQLAATTQAIEALQTELKTLNYPQEIVEELRETLHLHAHQNNPSPMASVIADQQLDEKQKIKFLEHFTAQNNLHHYQYEAENTYSISPLYYAVGKPMEVFKTVLEGVKHLKPEEKNVVLNKREGTYHPPETPLLYAIQLGDFDKVKLLVEAGCDLNKVGVVGPDLVLPPILYAYHLAVSYPRTTAITEKESNSIHMKIVHYLMQQKGIDINAMHDWKNYGLLHMAVMRGDLKFIDTLLADSRISVELKNKDGDTPLSLALEDYDVPDALRYDIIRKFVNTGQTRITDRWYTLTSQIPTLIQDNNGNSYLHRAILHQDLTFVKWLADPMKIHFVSLIYRANNADEMPLQTAARMGNLEIFQWLWNTKIHLFNVNAFNKDGSSALSVALAARSHEIVQFILASDQLNLEELKENNGHLQLLAACIHNNAHLNALLKKGIELYQFDQNGNTFLHLAAAAGDLSSIQSLVHHVDATAGPLNNIPLLKEQANRVPLHPYNTRNQTPLMLACINPTLDENTKQQFATYFIEKSTPNDLFKHCDDKKNNILHHAVKTNNLWLVQKLAEVSNLPLDELVSTSTAKETARFRSHLFRDEHLTQKNNAGCTAFHLATSLEMVKYIFWHQLVDIDIRKEGPLLVKQLLLNENVPVKTTKAIVRFIAKSIAPKNQRTMRHSVAPTLFPKEETSHKTPEECIAAYQAAYTAMKADRNNTDAYLNTLKGIQYCLMGLLEKLDDNDNDKEKEILASIKKIVNHLHFEEKADCHLMKQILKETIDKERFMTSYYLWKLEDNNSFTLTHAAFHHHPALLTKLLRISPMLKKFAAEKLHDDVCKPLIKRIVHTLQNTGFQGSIKNFIEDKRNLPTIETQENFKDYLNDIYPVEDYPKFLEKSASLLIDESTLTGNALVNAKEGNKWIHIGCMLEALHLMNATVLLGVPSQSLFEHARTQPNRELYIEVVKIYLEELKIPTAKHTPMVIPSIFSPTIHRYDSGVCKCCIAHQERQQQGLPPIKISLC